VILDFIYFNFELISIWEQIMKMNNFVCNILLIVI
jgi:hypothetical protein